MKDEASACREVRARLIAWIDGERAPEEAQQIAAHLAGCADCAREHADLADLTQLADTWRVETDDLWPTLRAEMAATDMAKVASEVSELREEVARLRAEVAALRSERSVQAPRLPSLLLPYTTEPTRTLHIA